MFLARLDYGTGTPGRECRAPSCPIIVGDQGYLKVFQAANLGKNPAKKRMIGKGVQCKSKVLTETI
jgi:hypothetical protein